MRVGLGYDIHPLGPNRKLILGGVEIPHTQGLVGHSDADALAHAVCDAMLGAMGEGDLGKHYPSSDPKYKNISSLLLLEEVNGLLGKKGYRLVNLDTVIIAQAPRLGPHLAAMQARLAEVLKIELGQVNVKVKSGEGLDDAIGREEAIAAQAICLIEPVSKS
ncbi:MAG: 2-C-methyl-D-erythritol 2,4-cyclodiphosphate synthase [Nitrospirae bacterium]|nr:MAG: 2-C-methyl-D-erythritol 2,4-cyclodiphosphate synthase [Nitrospirota bacterium]